MRNDIEKWARLGALRQVRAIEMDRRRAEVKSVRLPDQVALEPPPLLLDPDTGRRQLAPDPALVLAGRYFRRSRAYAQLSQRRLAELAGVSQSMVSRFERGLAPHMASEKLIAMCVAVGRLFPLGVCPHDHDCGWQPVRPPKRLDPTLFLDYLRQIAGEA